jgi:hypothetical protein
MLETIYVPAMALFALMMGFVAVHPHIHTGTVGAVGCIVMSGASVLAMDVSTFASVPGTMRAFLIMCAGVGLVVANLFWMLYKASKPVERFKHPLRRSTDFQLDDSFKMIP